MVDKNGVEIMTGDTVKISGAFFKNDNGLFLVTHSPGDPAWCGKEHCLKKMCKNGRLSNGARTTQFWPLIHTAPGHMKRHEARKHDEENAEIEVIPQIPKEECRKYFSNLRIEAKEASLYYTERWGAENKSVIELEKCVVFYKTVIDRIIKR